MSEQSTSAYWLDQAVSEITEKYPKGEIVVSSGISPSANYHVGHFREILTADALTWGLKKAGREAKHIHVVDNFDPLRRRYNFLPEWLEKYVGMPICLIPAPDKSSQTYADYFYKEFEQYAQQMGIFPDQVIKSYEDLYKAGRMAPYIESVLTNLEAVHKIFKEISNRELDKNWTPVQVLDDENRFYNAKADTWDKKSQTIDGKKYAKGEAKLNWRLDWPARWVELGVKVEPFGRELASAGSAYATGVSFVRDIYKSEPPLPTAKYESIYLPGDRKKMSSSLGNFITPKEALGIMPPEILRYFVVRSRPERSLYFDSSVGLYNLVDEFSQVESTPDHEFKEAYEFAVSSRPKGLERTISSVPFKHLVSVYQAAQGKSDEIHSILERTGFGDISKKEKPIIENELKFVARWLKKYAPEEAKFEVQNKIPKVDLSTPQKEFLTELADKISSGDLDAQALHESIYELAGDKVKPAEAFQAIYRVILDKDRGPRAGWFLASLDKNWLIKRLRLEA